VKHLLVTNDFPPKIGGIQSYLWELWRRLPADETVVLTTPHAGSSQWDRAQAFRVVRTREPVLLPHPWLVRRVDALAREVDAQIVLLDPALPLGAIGPWLERPYGVVVHGAEVTVPGRLPLTRPVLGRVLRGARLVVAAGGYPASEARHAAGCDLPIVVVPPGVDVHRFQPLDGPGRLAARAALGLPADGPLVVGVSRLVPRKGFDVLIEAVAGLSASNPGLTLAISGGGRDADRLAALAERLGAPVRFLGRLPDADLASLYASADVFAMLCRNRWGGLEQEGFGIVFAEAAAAGVPQVAGRSGGAAEAVIDGVTGLVVDRPDDRVEVAAALSRLLDDPALRAVMGVAARQRAEAEFTYDALAARLNAGLGALS
jgi:phosphatidylinositol alpha-1,6-mannosyltransferase